MKSCIEKIKPGDILVAAADYSRYEVLPEDTICIRSLPEKHYHVRLMVVDHAHSDNSYCLGNNPLWIAKIIKAKR